MRAMILREFSQPLLLADLPVPELRAHEVLVRVRASGICGTDVKAHAGLVAAVQPPRVLGHELAGDIVQVGDDVPRDRVGTRVCAYMYETCGLCEYCRTGRENICQQPGPRVGFERDGGFAEFVTLRASNALPIPDGLPYEEAAVLGDAAATALHAIRRAHVTVGTLVAIVGIGGLGSHALELALAHGAEVIAADVQPQRLALARDLGAARAVDLRVTTLADEARAMNGNGVDVALDFAGRPETAQAAFASLKPDGQLIIVGYDPDANLAVNTQGLARSQRRIMGSRGSTRQDLIDVIEMVRHGRMRALVGTTLPLEAANEGLANLRSATGIGKTVLTIGGS